MPPARKSSATEAYPARLPHSNLTFATRVLETRGLHGKQKTVARMANLLKSFWRSTLDTTGFRKVTNSPELKAAGAQIKNGRSDKSDRPGVSRDGNQVLSGPVPSVRTRI